MNAVRKRLLPSSSVLDAMLPLVTMDVAAFDRFWQRVSTVDGFASDKARCEAIAGDVGISTEDIGILLTVLDGLYQRVRDIREADGADRESLMAMLRGFVDEIGEDEPNHALPSDWKELLNDRLVAALIDNSANIEKSRKIARLRAGFVRNATRIGSFVDLRPDFSEDGASIDKWVPIIQFRITTDSDAASTREFVFQCDQHALKKFREALDRAERKLSTLFDVSNRLKIDTIDQNRGN